jgi:Protein of unknown function (DUF3237)
MQGNRYKRKALSEAAASLLCEEADRSLVQREESRMVIEEPAEGAAEPAEPALRLLYTCRVAVGAPLVVGNGPHGARRIIPIQGGSFTGPRLSGRVLPGGADWQVVRSDGVTELEARYTLETDDGALIYVFNPGIRTGPKAVMEGLAGGDKCDSGEYYFRTRPVFETGAAQYQWLHAIVAVATGERLVDEVIITAYEVL